MGRLTTWYLKIFGLHDVGNARCPQCPDHWPIEHKKCGGLFHANTQVSPAKTKLFIAKTERLIVCDRCGQRAELFQAGNIGSPEEARRLERMILAQATSESRGDDCDGRQ